MMGKKMDSKVVGTSRGGMGSGSKPSGKTTMGVPNGGKATHRHPDMNGKGLKGN